MKTFLRAPLALALCGLSSFSLADTLSLSDQVVTATRTSQSNSIAATSVFERADIERMQATSVDQVLRRVPGVRPGVKCRGLERRRANGGRVRLSTHVERINVEAGRAVNPNPNPNP